MAPTWQERNGMSDASFTSLQLVLPNNDILNEILSVEDNGVAGVNETDEFAASQVSFVFQTMNVITKQNT